MALIREVNMKGAQVEPIRKLDAQTAFLNEALRERNETKNLQLLRLHSVTTKVTYYEQIITDRVNNISNTASLNKFDPNLARFRKIEDFVILTDGEIDPGIEKDIVTNIVYTGNAKILPNTVIPNVCDFFTMKVLGSLHCFRITEVNPIPIEKDSGYEIRFELWEQDTDINPMELEKKVNEEYTFSYQHVGTDFRTVFRNEEFKFLLNASNVQKIMLDSYIDGFYHKVLNTFMARLENKQLYTCRNRCKGLEDFNFVSEMIVGETNEQVRTIYDNNLVHFMNKFKLTSSLSNVYSISEYTNFNRKMYDRSIFCAMEYRDINRFQWNAQTIRLEDRNLYNKTNKLFGRFTVEFEERQCPKCTHCGKCDLRRDLFPDNFVRRLFTFDPDKLFKQHQDLKRHKGEDRGLPPSAKWGIGAVKEYVPNQSVFNPKYDSPLDLFIDMIALFLSGADDSTKRTGTIKLLNILLEQYKSDLFASDYDDPFDVFYIYPLIIFILKFYTKDISLNSYQ